jgi:hypothetical protein
MQPIGQKPLHSSTQSSPHIHSTLLDEGKSKSEWVYHDFHLLLPFADSWSRLAKLYAGFVLGRKKLG